MAHVRYQSKDSDIGIMHMAERCCATCFYEEKDPREGKTNVCMQCLTGVKSRWKKGRKVK